MDEAILKAFFVKLGWQVDEKGEKKVTQSIAAVTKGAAGLALALRAAATAVTTAVGKIAHAFDTLQFTSMRTGASVQNIRSLSHAFTQVGGSGGQAVGALESFARAMRTNPGVGQFVRDLGVATTQGGKARDTLDVLSDAIDAIERKHSYFVGQQMAGLLGIDEGTFHLLVKHRDELKTYRAEYDRTAKMVGLNNKEAAESSARFSRALTSLSVLARTVGERLLVSLAPAIEKVVRGILSWIEANPEAIAKAFDAIGAAVDGAVKAFAYVYDRGKALFDYLATWAESMHQDGSFLRVWERIVSVFEKVAAAIKPVVAMLGQLERITDTSEGFRQIGRILGIGSAEAATGRGGMNAAQPEKDERNWWQRTAPKWLGGKDAPGGSVSDDGTRLRGQGAVSGSQADREQRVMARLIARGWTPVAAATAVGQAVEESGVRSNGPSGDHGTAHGMFQWRHERFAALKRFAAARGKDWTDFDTQVDFFDQERKTRKARERDWHNVTDFTEGNRAGFDFERYRGGLQPQREAHARRIHREWSRRPRDLPQPEAASEPARPWVNPPSKHGPQSSLPANLDVAALTAAPPLGANPTYSSTSNTVHMNSPTTIKIDGSGDPATTGGYVERAVTRASERNLRNAQTAIG